ncbi:MAG TPA: histidine phosphatase family protein [Candidatus Baltobacteraceae bacterium]|nr:histidine phosphatase family protein [Candidatus Baltobacteraceae bacterium]
MELILVRHGQTEWNASHRFQGHTDVPLSARGRGQASALADALRNMPFTHVYASDLVRALETARAIAAPHGLRVATDARLREFDFGAWEGLTWAQIVAREPELGERAPTQARLYAPTGGERFDQVVERVRFFFDEMLPGVGPRAYVLIVMHAGTLHAAIEVLRPQGVDPLGISFAPAGITRLTMEEGRWRIIT